MTVAKKGATVGTYTECFYIRTGNPGTLPVPSEPGEYELRYSTKGASPNPTLFSLPLTMIRQNAPSAQPTREGPGSVAGPLCFQGHTRQPTHRFQQQFRRLH